MNDPSSSVASPSCRRSSWSASSRPRGWWRPPTSRRSGSSTGERLPDARMIRVWVLESQAEKAQKIARRALSGDDAI